MVAASNILNLAVASDKQIRNSIRGVLGWDEAAYTRYRLSMPAAQYRRLLNEYGQVCAKMAGQYKQWASNLMLEWHLASDKSNYLSPYPHQQAPKGIQELAHYRLEYLDLLYGWLPQDELKVYGELLSPGHLVTGCMPDIKAAYVLYKMQDVLQLERFRVTDTVDGGEIFGSASHVAFTLTDLMRQHVDKELGPLLKPPPGNHDSLFSQLLLNTAVNRALLELAEFSRLDHKAQVGMVALVQHLRTFSFGDVLPRVRSLKEIREIVSVAMRQPALGYDWRQFRGHAVDKVLQRAEVVAGADEMMVRFPNAEPYRWDYVLLTALAVAWSYCTKEIHDSRSTRDNHRTREVIDGRSQENPKTYPPNLRLYHQRQVKLLWFSEQMHVLNADRVAQEHANSQYLRDTLRAYLYKFKGLTLNQWAKLDIVLSRLLRGSNWDQLELLVTSDHEN